MAKFMTQIRAYVRSISRNTHWVSVPFTHKFNIPWRKKNYVQNGRKTECRTNPADSDFDEAELNISGSLDHQWKWYIVSRKLEKENERLNSLSLSLFREKHVSL